MNFKNLFSKLIAILILTGCNSFMGKGGGDRSDSGSGSPGAPKGSQNGADSLSVESISQTEIYTKDAVEKSCTKITFSASAAKNPAKDVEIAVEASSSDSKLDGALSAKLTKTDSAGKASVNYCSGDVTGKVIIIGRAGTLSANSAEINIKKRAVYKFIYTGEEGRKSTTQDADKTDTQLVKLNLADQGPNACTVLYFKLLRGTDPVKIETIKFRSGVDYPKGAKLAIQSATAGTTVEASTGKTYLTFDAVSNQNGDFGIPVCAGVSLGNMVVLGKYTDPDEKKEYTAQSPIIVINSGVANYQNMTLTFSQPNGRSLKGFFNSNSDYQLPVQVKLGARQDGDPILDFQVSIVAETGKVFLKNNGRPADGTGIVDFTLQALHLRDFRPYPVMTFSDIDAQNTCDPIKIAASSATDVNFFAMSKNWRSTVLYMIRGQESFHDANGNGVYDPGGDGFWDKNQNGIYDPGIDVLTYDAGNNGFDPNGEWFIDLPTPFVDVDEDGIFKPNIDILIGDSYQAPNGKRDSDALIWKSEYFPIYLGTSPYSLQRSRIVAGGFNIISTTDVDAYFTAQAAIGLRASPNAGLTKSYGLSQDIDPNALWGVGATDVQRSQIANVWRHVFVHDICGSIVPGGTIIRTDFTGLSEATYGKRNVTAHYYMQPGDSVIEPSRRLLSESTGANSSKVNFNPVEHPSSTAGYPVEFNVNVASCQNQCTGTVSVPGVACDAAQYLMGTTVDTDTVNSLVTLPSIQTCTCGGTTTLQNGVCK